MYNNVLAFYLEIKICFTQLINLIVKVFVNRRLEKLSMNIILNNPLHFFVQFQRKRGKLRKELEKEHEALRNNILRDVNNQQDTNMNERIRTLKEKHVADVKKLKQNFCDKLEKISQAKSKWMKEEEAKRINTQVDIKIQDIFICCCCYFFVFFLPKFTPQLLISHCIKMSGVGINSDKNIFLNIKI